MRALLLMYPTGVAHEAALLAAVPGCEPLVISDHRQTSPGDLRILRSLKVPFLGRPAARSAALSWILGLNRRRLGHLDLVGSVELFAPRSWQAHRLSRRLCIPHVVFVFENLADNPLYRWPPWSIIAGQIARRADLFVCFTESARRHAISRGCPPDRAVVISPGIDTHSFRPPSEGRPTTPRVVFVGELRADRGSNKGLATVIAACQVVRNSTPDLELVVIGDGPLIAWARNKASTLPFLKVLGPLPHDAIAIELHRSRVFAIAPEATAKWSEQFGVAVVEAMSVGLPVVTTRCGSLTEVVGDWNALVDEGDVAAFAAGLTTALGRAGDAWGIRNREDVIQRFDLRTQGERLGKMLEKVSVR